MIIGICEIELFIPEGDSLKSKRMILNHLKDKVKNKFNVSIAEVEEHDKWQRAVLGVAAVSTTAKHAESSIDTVVEFIEQDDRVQVIRVKKDML